MEIVKSGRHCVVHLNGGAVAAELLRDASTAAKAEKAKKGRRKEGSSESDTKSDKGSLKNGKPETAPREPNKSLKSFIVGDYPPIESRTLTSSSRTVLVSHYNSWKELWVQDNADKAILFTKQLNENLDQLGDTVTVVKVADNQSITEQQSLFLFYFFGSIDYFLP